MVCVALKRFRMPHPVESEAILAGDGQVRIRHGASDRKLRRQVAYDHPQGVHFEPVEIEKKRYVSLELRLALYVDEELQDVRVFDIAQLLSWLNPERVVNGEMNFFPDALNNGHVRPPEERV